MANVVVTSTTNSILVAFNDEASKYNGVTNALFAKSSILEVSLNADFVMVKDRMGNRFSLRDTANGATTMIVDSVDGVAPTSLSDLYSKITALIG